MRWFAPRCENVEFGGEGMRKKSIAIVMVCLMMFSICGTVFAEAAPDYYSIIFREVRETAPWLGEEWADWIAKAILWSCDRRGVDPILATSVIKQESGFCHYGRSYFNAYGVLESYVRNENGVQEPGALGFTQLMPETAAGLVINIKVSLNVKFNAVS